MFIQGQMFNGTLHGDGIFKRKDVQVLYKGEFCHGNMSGSGMIIWPKQK